MTPLLAPPIGWRLKWCFAKLSGTILTILRWTFGLWVLRLLNSLRPNRPTTKCHPWECCWKSKKVTPLSKSCCVNCCDCFNYVCSKRLEQPSKWSKDFNDFLAKALIKDPQKRPTCDDLLKHPFINRTLDSKPVIDLLLEYRAEVVEEELTDDDPEVSLWFFDVLKLLCHAFNEAIIQVQYLYSVTNKLRV